MSFSYQTTTISELMSELDSLGGTSQVKMYNTHLTALINNNPRIQHFSSSDNDYITYENGKKKYFYDQIAQRLNHQTIINCLEHFDQGFNVTLVLCGNVLAELLRIIYKQDELAINHYLYPMDPSQPTAGLIQNETKTKSDYYEWDAHLKIESVKNQVTLTKIISKSCPTNQMKIISLPNKAFEESSPCKSQLIQLIQNLEKNPDKSRKEIGNRLFMKKHKIVSMFIQNVFDTSLNYLIHDCSQTNKGIFQFCNKFRGLSNFSVRGENSIEQTVVKVPIKHQILDSSHEKAMIKTIEKNQLEYCRKLERKTHKYSIKSIQQQQEYPASTYDTIPTQQKIYLSPEQELQVLKSQHMIQVSKYHQTIQSLNSKLLILTKQNNVDELCNVYEREIMMLELKIQQLRDDVVRMRTDNKDDLKIMIKKLHQQIKVLEKSKSQTKSRVHQNPDTAKLKAIEKKLEQSETTRAKLTQELKSLTSRLSIREKQIQQSSKRLQQFTNMKPIDLATLNVSSQKQLSELNTLLNQLNNGNNQAYIFIKNKINHLFKNLSSSKKLLIQSNEFLIQFQKIVQEKIQQHDPAVVLDCNRFIRSFLMKCVEIHE